jgi:hypothetical protein
VVRESNLIKPCGFLCPDEVKLGEAPGFLNDDQRESVTAWWLEIRARANTPNWDLVANCAIDDKPGLLLVEAKAHSNELKTGGKTNNGRTNQENHRRIAEAIDEANNGLQAARPGSWALSRDSHYQLSNRFAWAWKIATLRIPVVLLYLGFLDADEVEDCGQPFRDAAGWDSCVRSHARGIVPDDVWERRIEIGEVSFVPLIRSISMTWLAEASHRPGGPAA